MFKNSRCLCKRADDKGLCLIIIYIVRPYFSNNKKCLPSAHDCLYSEIVQQL